MWRAKVFGTTTAVVCAAGASIAWARRWDWGPTISAGPLLTLILVSVWLSGAAAVVVVWWRPHSRLWWGAAALSVSWSLFVVTIMTPLDDGGFVSPALLIRPSLFFLLLAWPSGYLARSDRTWWTVYVASQAALLWAVPQLFDSADGRPLVIADADPLAAIAHAFGLAVVLPVGGVVLLVAVRRRAGMLPAEGRRMLQPIVVAAGVMMVSELVLSAWVAFGEPGFDDRRPELLGGLMLIVNYLPYATTPVLVMMAVRRARKASPSTTSIEIGPVGDVLHRAMTGSGTVRLDVRFAASSGVWLDSTGQAVAAPDRSVPVVEIRRDDQVLAVVATGDDVSPDQIERAVASAGASVDFARLAATDMANQRAAMSARQAFATAREVAMTRLERDLHDGAQQRLVGLALQASMAARTARDDDHVAEELRIGVRAAQDDLAGAASGMLPTLISARGLSASIGNLAACAALQVDVDVDLPADIPADVAAGAWFVAAEAVANAGKHAGASRLRVRGAVADDVPAGPRLEIWIDDDGRGGADTGGSGLVGLRRRVEQLGGDLQITSPVGGGTTIRARFPVPSTCEVGR